LAVFGAVQNLAALALLIEVGVPALLYVLGRVGLVGAGLVLGDLPTRFPASRLGRALGPQH
jgi:hypothetical protein